MRIGLIGCGHMGSAIVRGLLGSGLCGTDDLMASARSQAGREKIVSSLGIACGSNEETAAFADVLILAVKPVSYPEVTAQIAGALRDGCIVISLAPGISLEALDGMLQRPVKLVRAMPNTPAMVSEGMTGLCPADTLTDKDRHTVLDIFSSFGRAEIVPERLMNVVTGVSGSSPAFIFILIEAMADAAVADGMPRAQAYTFAAQAVLGSARMVLESGEHPAVLKDQVCSPGGTTIEGVRVLEEKGLRSAVIEAVRASTAKA